MNKARVLPIAVCLMMVLSAFAIVLPSMLGGSDADDSVPASTEWQTAMTGFKREAYYKFNHWGESYLKNEMWNRSDFNPTTADMSTLGHHGIFSPLSMRTVNNPTGMGVSEWLNESASANGTCAREAYYGELGVRTDHFPYIFANNPNSAETPGIDKATATDFIIWTPYRLSATIKNESTGRTGSDQGHTYHAWFVPHLGANSLSGGFINATYYGTYLTTNEVEAIKSPGGPDGVHYAQWFYNCTGTFLSGSNDGYFYELQGKIQYSRQAAIAYLGWSGIGNIVSWWYGNGANVEAAWVNDWKRNGSDPKSSTGTHDHNSTFGVYSIYTNYEYDLNNSGLCTLKLQVDVPNSTANTITLRLYSISWGIDSLILRLMEKCNVSGFWLNNTNSRNYKGSMIDYHEDLYWNISANPGRSNMTVRMVTAYRMTAWEDPSTSVFMGGWMLEAFHTDYMGNGAGIQTSDPPHYWSYLSPFNRYDPDQYSPDRTSVSRAPGTRRYQKNASYWTTPVVRNISKYECFIYDLNASHWGMGNRDFIGINATWYGDSTMDYSKALKSNRDSNNFTKNFYWGRLKLGDYCTPFPIVKTLAARYDNMGRGGYNNLTGVLNITGSSSIGAGTVGIYMERYVTPVGYALSGRDYWTASGSAYAYQNGRVYARGMPFIQMDVVPVEDYKITAVGYAGQNQATKLKVEAVNASGQLVTSMWGLWKTGTTYAWNGSVYLTSTNGNFVVNTTSGRASGQWHNFTQSDRAVWWTAITFTSTGAQTITAIDRTNNTGTPRGDGNSRTFNDIRTRLTVTVGATDTTPPVNAITAPSTDPTYSASTPTINLGGNATDANGIYAITWKNVATGASGTATGAAPWSINDVALNMGDNLIYVNATGNDWLTASDSITITRELADLTAPIVTITVPAVDPYFTSASPVALSGTASDPESGITEVTWKNMLTGGSGTATGTTSWDASVSLNAGSNLIYVNATNGVGMKSSDSITVTQDIGFPTVDITTPASDPESTTAVTIDLSGTSSDDVEIVSVTWSNAATGAYGSASGTTGWSITGVMLDVGSNLITVQAEDEVGNTGSDTITVIRSLAGRAPHATMYINGDVVLALKAVMEGWSGDGSASNPYIITGYDISATSNNGIYICNTNSHIVVDNIVVTSTSHLYKGIYLNNADNVDIQNCMVTDSKYGIYLVGSNYLALDNCNATSNSGNGIYVLNSNHITMNDCDAVSNLNHGIHLGSCQNVNITGGLVASNSWHGIYARLCTDLTFYRNDVLSNGMYGIYISGGSLFQIMGGGGGGRISNNLRSGIMFAEGTTLMVEHMSITQNNWYGVHNIGGTGLTINDCDLSGNKSGPTYP